MKKTYVKRSEGMRIAHQINERMRKLERAGMEGSYGYEYLKKLIEKSGMKTKGTKPRIKETGNIDKSLIDKFSDASARRIGNPGRMTKVDKHIKDLFEKKTGRKLSKLDIEKLHEAQKGAGAIWRNLDEKYELTSDQKGEIFFNSDLSTSDISRRFEWLDTFYEGKQIRDSDKNAIIDFASGRMSEDEFMEMVNR